LLAEHGKKERRVTQPPGGFEWQRAIVVLSGTVVSLAAIGILFWAQSIFIPVALAAFFTFILSPLVSWLKGRGLGRTPAVIVTVFLAALALSAVGWLVTNQISELLRELPGYSETIKKKVRSVKALTLGSSPLGKLIAEIDQELEGGARRADQKQSETEDPVDPTTRRPTAVVIEPQTPVWLSRVTAFLSPLMEYVGELSLSLILVVFMLQKREELRNRIIRLLGDGHIVLATKFVDEAAQRISRFLLLQAIVNGTFGVILASGLLAIGVRYAILWGFLAALLRYLPYIGPYLAAVLPISLSLAMFDGWSTTLLVIVLFVVLELVVANLIEPWLYGQSMGVSEIALLVSAAFWAFLWGPIGLVLSSPLTVCLVMLGRYVPQLQFLSVLLGDKPALDAGVSFYQRLLARDQDEALGLVVERQKTAPPDEVYDSMLVPALSATKLCRARGDISESDEDFILQSIEEIVEDLRDGPANKKRDQDGDQEAKIEASSAQSIPVFGCPAHHRTEEIALEMLKNLLGPARWRLQVIGTGTLTAELLELVANESPAMVVIMVLPSRGRVQARYLCKKLKARFPELRIMVCRWAQPAGADHDPAILEDVPPLADAGADCETTTLLETRQELMSLLPVLAQNRSLTALGSVST
jgi:predicted PurR-regulated permease PerM